MKRYWDFINYHLKNKIMKKTKLKCCGKVWRLWNRKDRYPGRKHEDTPQTQTR